MVLDATTIGRLSIRHLLPRSEILRAIKWINPIGTLADSTGERIYPLVACESAVTKALQGQPKGVSIRSLEKTLNLSRKDCLATLTAIGLGYCGIDFDTPIPHITFKYMLEDLQKKGKFPPNIVSVVELSLKFGVTDIHIASLLNLSFVPVVLKSRLLAYRFYERQAAERVLKEKLAPDKVKPSMLDGNFRTYGMLLTEFEISRIDLSAVVLGMYPSKRWTMNGKMSREYYETIKQELIKREYKRRR
jgi:hypothetical protein